jgi:hypothetical protein
MRTSDAGEWRLFGLGYFNHRTTFFALLLRFR